MIVPSPDIEAALQQHLPHELHGVASALAQAITDAMTGASSPAEAQARMAASPDLASALRSLAGREVATHGALVSFGAGSQIGDVTISGDVAGGNIVKLTINVSPQTIIKVELSRHDRDNRQRMLDQIHLFWIKGVLEQSLYRELLISLNLQTDPKAVSFSGPRLAAMRNQEAETLPVDTTIAQAYEQANRRLLILGAPGAGKTTLLLDLARHLLEEARRDETRPIPVIFNLSSWAQQRPPLDKWLVQELRDQYSLSKRFAQQWLKENIVLPLLDGLDEVAEPQRAGCVATINSFMQEHGAEGIVVCSRIADYQAIGARLSLDVAVQVQPLDDAQIAQYLDWVGEPLAGVKAVLDQDDDLRTLARAPLMLNILALAYEGRRPEELLGLETATQRRHLFDRYVRRMFERPARSDPKRYTRKQTLCWLRWLARNLNRDKQTIFQIELMQPWWLRHWWQRGLYVLFATLGTTTGGVMLGVIYGALLGMVIGLGLEALIWGFPASVAAAHIPGVRSPGSGLVSELGDGLVLGLISGLFSGLFSSLIVSIFQHTPGQRYRWRAIVGGLLTAGLTYLPWTMFSRGTPNLFFLWSLSMITLGLTTGALIKLGAIQPTEALRWSWHRLRARWYLGLVFGLIGGLGGGLNGGLGGGLGGKLVGGILVGMLIGGLGGLGGGLVQVDLRTKNRPNQGIWRALWRAVGVWMIFELVGGVGLGLSLGLLFGLNGEFVRMLSEGLFVGLLLGLIIVPEISLYFGGLAFVQHFALRLVCTLSGDAPWRYPRFLDYAVERILLRRIGGSYIFVHRLLMEHVAGMTDEEIGRS